MVDHTDYVVVIGGANDKRLNIPLGDIDSSSTEIFCGALNVLRRRSYRKIP